MRLTVRRISTMAAGCQRAFLRFSGLFHILGGKPLF
jgi:hypothetical protein